MSELWKQAWEPRLALARAALGIAGKSLNSSQPSRGTKGLLRAESPATVHGSTPLCLCLPHHVRAPYSWPVLHGMYSVHRPATGLMGAASDHALVRKPLPCGHRQGEAPGVGPSTPPSFPLAGKPHSPC